MFHMFTKFSKEFSKVSANFALICSKLLQIFHKFCLKFLKVSENFRLIFRNFLKISLIVLYVLNFRLINLFHYFFL